MNQNELFDSWLAEKRELTPPTEFSQRIMSSVQRSAESRPRVTRAFTQSRLTDSQCVPIWVTSAAVLVCIMRTACFVQMLIEPMPEGSLVSKNAISEMSNVK
jgi:hypothetical protein